MRYGDYTVRRDTSAAQALRSLERNEYKALVLEEEGVLYGVLTDGDIRRFLLNNGDLSRPVELVATSSPSCVTGYREAAARDMLEELDCTVVPMMGKNGRIHALVFKDATLHREQNHIKNPVVIMAGGLGTRLYPYTEILPKPLMPIGRVTITEHIIDRFKKFGCKDFTLVVNHQKNLIKSYFAETASGYNLDFVEENVPLGTGGGLAFLKGRFGGSVFVTYCDNVIEADYGDVVSQHEREKNALTVVLAKKTFKIPYGVIEVEADGEVAAIREKPQESYLINAGFYVVSPAFIDLVEDNKFQHITDIIAKCQKHGLRVGSYSIDEDSFIDIGQLEDLRGLGNKLR